MAAFQEKPMGFFTDTSICIGCKACEVACKEWNQLQGDPPKFTADSFDNTGQLDAQNWRHVQFIEQVPDNTGMIVTPTPIAGGQDWLMMSDVCKHCKNASCLEVWPTNDLMPTEVDTASFVRRESREFTTSPRGATATSPTGTTLPGFVGGVTTAVIGLVAGLLASRTARRNGTNGGSGVKRPSA